MSLPSLNPDKTAAGIVIDPRTLERVVPQSRRKDGTVRKELKIRPGFTPQEDVGRFKTARQQASEISKSSIPGSNRTRPPPPSNPDNPFAQPSGSKTKAQLKNEKRREKKKTTSAAGAGIGVGGGKMKDWDESDDDEDEGEGGDSGGMRAAFEAVDLRRHQEQEKLDREQDEQAKSAVVDAEPAGSEMAVDGIGKESVAPPSAVPTGTGKVDPATAREAGISEGDVPTSVNEGGGAGSRDTDASAKVKGTEEKKEDFGKGTTAILTAPPPGPDSQVVAPSLQPTSQAVGASASASTSGPPATKQSKADSAPAWRKNQNSSQAKSTTTTTPNGSKQPPQSQAKPHPIQGGRKGPIGLANPPPPPTSRPAGSGTRGEKSKPPGAAPSKPEPRVRKEVRVREGGATDLSSLASRVKNLVIANTTNTGGSGGGAGGVREREKK